MSLPSYIKYKMIRPIWYRVDLTPFSPADEQYREVGEYKICRGKHYDPKHTRSQSVFFIALREKRVVGIARRGLVWVRSEHRGSGLGTEMLCDLIQAYGGPRSYYIDYYDAQLTESGLSMHTKALKLLAERGVAVE